MGNKGLPSAVIYYDNICECDTTKLTRKRKPCGAKKIMVRNKNGGKGKTCRVGNWGKTMEMKSEEKDSGEENLARGMGNWLDKREQDKSYENSARTRKTVLLHLFKGVKPGQWKET